MKHDFRSALIQHLFGGGWSGGTWSPAGRQGLEPITGQMSGLKSIPGVQPAMDYLGPRIGAVGDSISKGTDYIAAHTPWGPGKTNGGGGSSSGGSGGLNMSNPFIFKNPNTFQAPTGIVNPLNSLGTINGQGVNGNGLSSMGAALLAQGQGALNGQTNAAGNLTNVYNGQSSFADALRKQALGQGGPGTDLASAMLAKATQNNIANGAGQISSIQGLNPALQAKMIAENTANQNQTAAMQGTQLGLENQLNAQGELGNVYTGMAGTLGTQGNLYGNAAGLGVGTGAGLSEAGTNANLTNQGQQLGAISPYNSTLSSGQIGAQTLNKDVGMGNLAASTGIAGGLANGLGGALAAGFGPGGAFNTPSTPNNNTTTVEQQSGNVNTESPDAGGQGGVNTDAGAADAGSAANIGYNGGYTQPNHGQVPAKYDHAALSLARHLMAMGGAVPGKAKVAGNNPRNDVVPAVLSPGEVVLPRSVTQSPDAAKKAEAFMEKLHPKDNSPFGKLLQARAQLKKAEEAHRRYMGGYA